MGIVERRDPDPGRPGSLDLERRSALGRVTSRILSDGSLTKKASLNAAASLVDQVARTLATLILNPILVSRLGDSVFGTWKVLQNLIGQVSPASGRPGEALKWTVAHDQASSDFDRKRQQVGNAVAVWLLFLPLLVGVGGALAWFAPGWLDAPAGSTSSVRLAAVLLVLSLALAGLAYLPQSVLQGENLGYKRLGLSTTLVFVAKGLILLAVLLGAGIVGMAGAVVTTTVLSGALYLYITRSQVPWFGIARPSPAAVWGFARLSGWFLLWNLIMQVMRAGDIVVLGIAASPALVTTYALARFAPQTITVGVSMAILSVMPGLGGLIGAGRLGRAMRVRTEAMSLVWLVTTVAGATVLIWQEAFLGLWVGRRYYPGATAMLAIMLMVLQFALIRTDSNIIDLTLDLRRKVLLGAISAALSVVFAWVFLSSFEMGITGLALGFILGRVILSVGYPLMIGRILGIPVRRQVRGAIRPALTTAALFAGAWGSGALLHAASWITLIPGVALTTLVIAGLAMFGGLSSEPRRVAWRRLRKVVRLR